VGLERGPLSLVSTTEELLDRKVAAPVWKTKLNFMVWVCERTIPTERPPLVGESIANLYG
jgi:hypothetical protein